MNSEPRPSRSPYQALDLDAADPSGTGANVGAGKLPSERRWPRIALHGRPGIWLAGLFLVVLLVAAVAPSLLTTVDPLATSPRVRLVPPNSAQWFGTDYLGRDLYSRVVHGTALSLSSALIALAIAVIGGGAVGLISAYAGPRIDSLLMRLADVFFAIPGLLLSLVVITAMGPGATNVAIAVGIAEIATFARLTRIEVKRVLHALYIEAATASGERLRQTIVWHVLPNASGVVLVFALLQLASMILTVASLSFLGFGAVPPTPEWGNLVAEGREYLATAWWLTTLPGLVVVAAVFSINRIGRHLEAVWERQA